MSRLETEQTSDQAARTAAIDPTTSVLVQAPAGSGKTDLLTLRYLTLLPTVAEPEQVLAITFTRKATAEMRARVLAAFASAERRPAAGEREHQRTLREAAAAALLHARARGWALEQQPQRLNIQTIDSLALSIAHQMPLLSRLGGQLNPVDDASALYALAARRTMELLGNEQEAELARAIAEVLKLRDASLTECESLIAGMLKEREQWLLLVPGIAQSSPAWDQLRAELEAPFRREHDTVVALLRQRLEPHVPLLLQLAHIGSDNGAQHLDILREIESVEELIEAAHWQPFCKMMLTGEAWRRAINKRDGFPASTHRSEIQQLRGLIDAFAADDGLLELLCRAQSLPPASYADEEWSAVRSIFILLRRATAELHVVFAEQGAIDFAEASMAAHAALGDAGVQMRQEDRIRHILVDEFQDTSRTQLALLRHLLRDWPQEEGRTCFFVGDPMQSIYLFRAAEASLFSRIREQGLDLDGSRIDVTPVTLSTNFRSTPSMVEELNDVFAQVLVEDTADAVGYAAAVSSQANREADGSADRGADGQALQMHVQLAQNGQKVAGPELREAQADAVLQQIRVHLPAIEKARREGTMYRVAVLVRSRPHLSAIVGRLRLERIAFRGVKIEPLAQRPEILDLLSLLQALLHPADRIAWLAVLRAPWCGLPLPALHALCGDDVAERRTTIPELLRQRSEWLSEDDRQRALHLLHVLQQAAAAYAAGLLSTTPSALSLWLERTWHALGAPDFLDAQARANAEVFFSALSQIPASSMGTLDESFNRALQQLYAEPDPATSDRCGVQVMTIHGAKGLEFEVVLIPALERQGRNDDPELFHSLIRRRNDGQGEELLLAPIGRKQDDKPPMYVWVGGKMSQKLRQEDKRLLYVACSRAIGQLHLFATAERDAAGALRKPRAGSLLSAGWDGLEQRVEVTLARAQAGMPQLDLFPHAKIDGGLMAAAQRQLLHRLPQSWFSKEPYPVAPTAAGAEARARTTSLRSPADRLARIRGTVLHALLAHAGTLNGAAVADDPRWASLTAALLRQHALGAADSAKLRAAILSALRNTLDNEHGRWLLSATDAAQNESSWTTLSQGRLQRHRPDRIFLGGAIPGAPGEECLWIVDYKTAAPEAGEDIELFVAQSREQYRGQLEMYSRVLRESNPAEAERPHRLAIYHPALPHLDWWPT